jgi:hypothetical protein
MKTSSPHDWEKSSLMYRIAQGNLSSLSLGEGRGEGDPGSLPLRLNRSS